MILFFVSIEFSFSLKLWNDFVRGDALDNPERTNRFFLLVFAVKNFLLKKNFETKKFFQDLKKYFFTFWFAFPTFLVPKSFELNSPVQSIGQRFSSEKVRRNFLFLQFFQHRTFLDRFVDKNFRFGPRSRDVTSRKRRSNIFSSLVERSRAKTQRKSANFGPKHFSYRNAKKSSFRFQSKIFFVVKDPSSDPLHPAWPIRNFLILIFLHL